MKKTLVLLICLLLAAMSLTACHSGGETSTPDSTVATITATTLYAPTEETTAPTDGDTTATVGTVPTDTTTVPTDPATTAKPTTTTTTTTKATTADWKKNYTSKQILRDNTFQNGFDVIGQASQGSVGVWRNTESVKTPTWQVAQWGTFKSYTDHSGYLCMMGDRLDTPANVLSNGLNTLTYNAQRKSITFTMNTYDYYGETGHINNDLWPHLLIQQSIIDRSTYFNLDDEDMPYYSPSADKIIIAFDVRMSAFEHKPLPGVNACQFLSFYYLRSIRDSGFIWFGLPLFDDRGYNPDDTDVHFNIDTGSGNYICNVPFVEVYNSTREDGRYDFFSFEDITKPEASEEWMHVELDIKPYLEIVFENAKKGSKYNVFSQTTSLDQMYFAGMNMGYEVHGAYDVSFEVMNYTITSYVKK